MSQRTQRQRLADTRVVVDKEKRKQTLRTATKGIEDFASRAPRGQLICRNWVSCFASTKTFDQDILLRADNQLSFFIEKRERKEERMPTF